MCTTGDGHRIDVGSESFIVDDLKVICAKVTTIQVRTGSVWLQHPQPDGTVVVSVRMREKVFHSEYRANLELLNQLSIIHDATITRMKAIRSDALTGVS